MFLIIDDAFLFFFFFIQVCQLSVQPPVNGELILRFQQLQSRLATLNIENEEVKQRKYIKLYMTGFMRND